MLPVWIVLLVLYVLLCGSYAYHLAKKENSRDLGIYSFVIGLGLPVIGFIFLWFCDVVHERTKDKNYLEIFTGQNRRKDDLVYLREPDIDEDLNHVPMEDALKFNTFEYRRNMIMNLLNEEDTLQYIDVLQSALDNDDTETSHYASTVIMEMRRKIQEELTEKEVQYEKNRFDLKYAEPWEEILFKVLNSSLFDEQNKKRYFVKYERLAGDLMEKEILDEHYYENWIKILFKLENYTEAEQVCSTYLSKYPESDKAAEYQIQLFIKMKDLDRLRSFMEEIHKNPVLVTNRTREYISIFGREN